MDAIYKLQPHRTMQLQGFDAFGAAAAFWGASDTGFTVSGVFRDQADFAILVLFQKDDPFGHPRFSYLPDGNFVGITLDFDITWQGIQAFESKKSGWTDWPTLNCLKADNTTDRHSLMDLVTVAPTGRTGASGVFTLNCGTIAAGDRVTLWYQNLAFDYTVPALTLSCDQAMWWQGNVAYSHWVMIGAATYSCLEDSLNSAQIAANIAGQINASDPNCTATLTGAPYYNELIIALKPGVAGPVAVSSSDGSATVTLQTVTPAMVCQNIADQINATDWASYGSVALTAVAAGNQITITSEPGADGNMVTFYELHSSGDLYFSPSHVQLSGGSSDNLTWHLRVDFNALGWTDIQKLWFTFAPALANGAAYTSTEWSVRVTNWSV